MVLNEATKDRTGQTNEGAQLENEEVQSTITHVMFRERSRPRQPSSTGGAGRVQKIAASEDRETIFKETLQFWWLPLTEEDCMNKDDIAWHNFDIKKQFGKSWHDYKGKYEDCKRRAGDLLNPSSNVTQEKIDNVVSKMMQSNDFNLGIDILKPFLWSALLECNEDDS